MSVEGCPECRIGVKHAHGVPPKGGMPTLRDVALCSLLGRWLEWSLAWGDQDMLQILKWDTRLAIHEQYPCSCRGCQTPLGCICGTQCCNCQYPREEG